MGSRKNHDLVRKARRFEGSLKAALRRLVRNPDDVEECLQDFYAHLLGVTPPGKVESWPAFFIEVLRNLTIGWLRQNSPRLVSEVSADGEAAEVADERARVEAQVNALQEQQILLDVLASVPPVVRRAYTLRKVYGLSHAEIAAQLAIDFHKVDEHLATVGRRFKNALRRSTPPRQAK